MAQHADTANEPPRGPITLEAALVGKPWGGRKLAKYGFRLPPDELIGEAHLTGGEATVLTGPLAGLTLDGLMQRDPAWLSGPLGLAATGGQPIFPLLITYSTSTVSRTHTEIRLSTSSSPRTRR